MNIHNRALALGVAGALALAAFPASAGPLMPIGSATVKSAVSDHVTDVRWRGRGGGIGPGIAFGLATGALVGAAVASRPYYGPGYGYYQEPVYAQPYGYAEPYAYEPVYPAPSYGYYGGGYRGCYTDEGNGRRRPCSAN